MFAEEGRKLAVVWQERGGGRARIARVQWPSSTGEQIRMFDSCRTRFELSNNLTPCKLRLLSHIINLYLIVK